VRRSADRPVPCWAGTKTRIIGKTPMPFPRFRIRTLMIAVAVAGVFSGLTTRLPIPALMLLLVLEFGTMPIVAFALRRHLGSTPFTVTTVVLTALALFAFQAWTVWLANALSR